MVLELNVEAGLKLYFFKVFAVKFLVEDGQIKELTDLVDGAFQYPNLLVCSFEDTVPEKMLGLGVCLIHCFSQVVLDRLLIILNLTNDQYFDNFRPIIILRILFIGVEETVSPENL